MLNADPAPIRAVAGPSRVAAVMSALVSVLVLVAVVPATAQAGPPTTTTVSATPSAVPPSTPDEPSPADSADVVSASRDQVRARVAALDEQTRAAEAAAAEAQGRVDAARARAADAQAKADQAAAAAAEATEQVRSYAVEAFVRPPAQDSLSTLAIEESRDAAYATDMLHIVAERRRRVVDTMTAARVVAEQDRAAASTAADAASAEAEQARTQVESLRSARAQQSRLASQLDDRLDRMLAEAAALREVDSRAAQEITAQEVALRWGEVEHTVRYRAQRNGSFLVGEGSTAVVHRWSPEAIDVEVDGERATARCTLDGDQLHLSIGSSTATLTVVPRFAPPAHASVAGGFVAPMPGTVLDVRVAAGDRVTAGQTLVVLEAMKMEHHMSAPADGVVAEVRVEPGTQVANGALLLVFEPSSEDS